MSSSDSIKPSLPSASVPFAAELESADPAVLQSSQNASLPRSPSNKQKIFRKSVPVITPNDITSPTDYAFQPDERFIISSQRKSTPPSVSVLPSSRRATLSPSQTSYPVVKSTFASSAMDLTSAKVSPKLSSSLTRNSSVPASLFRAPRSPNADASFTPAIQSRPSLSSPSPPTPIVPSIPLRYATQHSPAHSLTGMPSPPMPHASHSIAMSPLDRRFPSIKFPADQSPTAASFATASDPNLTSWSFSPTPDLNQYSVPLKKLLAKPARPSIFQVEGDAEGADPSGHRQRTMSSTESVRYTNPDFDISIEHEAVPSVPSQPGFRDRRGRDNYHYQRTTERINRDYQNKGRKPSSRASVDQNGWWSGWRRSEKETKPEGTGKDKIPNPPRNVLKRRPSNSMKATESRPRSPTHTGRRSLTRSLSASSFLKRTGFLREPSPGDLSPSSMAPNSPSPQPLHSISYDSSTLPLVADTSKAIEYDTKDNHLVHSHVEHASAQSVHKANINSNVVPNNDTAASSIPTDPLTPTSVSKEPSPAFLHSVPASKGLQHISGTRLSTISSVSGSSAGSKSREKALSPAGSIAETFRREQFGGESRNSSPRRALQSPSPNLRPTAPSSAEKAADNISSSKRSSNSGLSYADTKAFTENVISNQISLDGDVKTDAEISQQVSSGIGGVMVTTSVIARSSINQSATSTPSPTFSPRSSMSSPQLPSEPRPRNRLKKARHTSDQVDGFRPYYTVLGAQSEKIFSVGSPRDSLGEDWGIRTTITAGRPRTSDGIKPRPVFARSLTRKISGKFKRERSVGPGDGRSGSKVAGEDNEEGSSGKSLTSKLSGKVPQGRSARESLEKFEEDDESVPFGRPLSRKLSAKRKQNRPSVEVGERLQGRAVPQYGRATSTVPSPRTPEDMPADQKRPDDRCLPYLYSLKKQAQSETDIAQREKSNGTFFRRLFGKSRSKSRDFNVHGTQSDDPPPLPALPKHYVSDHRDVYVSPPPRKSSHSSKSSPSTPSARPSTTENAPRFWKRHFSAPSSTSSLEIPPTPSPRTNLKRCATMDDTNRTQTQTQKHDATRSRRAMHVEVELIYKPAIEVVRSDSPPIPSFSTVDTINSFPPRPSTSDRSKNSRTSVSTPSPTSPHAHLARNSQRPQDDTRQDSFGDEALYPPVMRPSTRPSPKMTYRELASGKGDAKLTEKEKADRWAALLEKSDAAGGTLHFGGIDDKLPSDDLRFSRTLSELARDDE